MFVRFCRRSAMHRALLLSLCLSCCALLYGADYYVKTDGNDASDGGTPDRAWKSLAKINAMEFAPGDRIFLQGGGVFEGGLVFKHGGSKEKPIVITNFGDGRATIKPTDKQGIYIENC